MLVIPMRTDLRRFRVQFTTKAAKADERFGFAVVLEVLTDIQVVEQVD